MACPRQWGHRLMEIPGSAFLSSHQEGLQTMSQSTASFCPLDSHPLGAGLVPASPQLISGFPLPRDPLQLRREGREWRSAPTVARSVHGARFRVVPCLVTSLCYLKHLGTLAVEGPGALTHLQSIGWIHCMAEAGISEALCMFGTQPG